MKRNASYILGLSLILPAGMAYLMARYLITNFFPDVTLIDLGAFYAIGLISGLSAGLSLGVYRKRNARD